MPSVGTRRSDTKVLSSLKRTTPGRSPIERHHACPPQGVHSTLRQTFVRRCHGVGAWTCLLLSNALPGNCSDPGGAPRNGRARTAGTSELGGELTYQRFSC